ncbi:TPA: TIGR03752 family integrating conjugative element protein [Pseudomonas aeruginosa]|uniref:TIGR03752 family integrating conjugative element protein n=1 Tax=Pseudomonas aeruginosa TaxID=287 RepID=UPI0005B3C774|nr:TIGR03752 family integrating conjugative element protein [Pseudomonas aeruginosa]MBG6973575.1 TIGR03752 family integrating conjugative element protein [Pseudomonas aeruginosa]MBG7548761.1 TIGR03752 family integrating conjugative element protein [Pseudomonas aeruginosa]MCU9029159.1 TIGR03752 family integrating conjugative element protein [Pseudomonas aeruginosa]HEJ2966739.1 TIGR03752 family integrating conjugative element protein [Pseudomonas aeruginosa]
MRSNGLLKWLMLPMAVLLVFIGIKLFSGDRGASPLPGDAGGQLTADEMRALGIEGDTPHDTVATLVAQVRQLRTELQTALSDNRNQRAENDRLRQRERSIEQRIQNVLDTERAQLRQDREQAVSERQQAQGLLQDLQRQFEGLGGRAGHTDLPIGLGLEDGDGQHFGRDGVRWIEPDDARPAEGRSGSRGGFSFPNDFSPVGETLDAASETLGRATGGAVGTSSLEAVYTVPSNSTLMGSIAMTALIGRVPIDGTVNDPYPFKVVIGPDNLTANGIDIPDVAGAVVSGTASGDWTLSCVRGQIRSITFVFEDGTIRTLPEESGRSSSNRSDTGTQGGLGWISDPYGIPCVSGERRSNAQQYLGTQALITAAGAGAASLIDSDSGRVSYVGSDGSIGTVGITANEAMGRILAGGVQEMSQWVNKLYGQAFAAVYVEPGAKVAVHIEQPLTIDYDAKGRRVDHRLGGSHVPDLD